MNNLCDNVQKSIGNDAKGIRFHVTRLRFDSESLFES